MCLYLYNESTPFLRKPAKHHKQPIAGISKLNEKLGDEEFICWKVYSLGENKLFAPCLWAMLKYSNIFWRLWKKLKLLFVKGYVIKKAGNVKSNRRSSQLKDKELSTGEVIKGIHVFTTKKEADYALASSFIDGTFVSIPVLCKMEDLVAEGTNGCQAVFTKIRITKETWNKIFPEN